MQHRNLDGQPEPVCDVSNILGESPLWDWRSEHLYWVDVRAPSLWRLQVETGQTQVWPMPEIVSSVVLFGRRSLIVALKSGLYSFDPATKDLALLRTIDEGHSGNRLNECRVDRSGALWWSTMWDYGKHTTGSLYRLNPDGSNDVIRRDITIPNALVFPPEGDCGCFADTATGIIQRFDFNRSGAVVNWRDFSAELSLPGRPDGSAFATDGTIINARYGGGALCVFSLKGEEVERIKLPVSHPTCCAFGGADLRTLFITTSQQKYTPEQLATEPLAGRLFGMRRLSPGLREPVYGSHL